MPAGFTCLELATMSDAQRFQVEPPPPPPRAGMSTAGKILVGCGVGCGVLLLLCCGGIAAVTWFGIEWMKGAVDRDPARIQAMLGGLATIDIPAGLQPKAAIDLTLPIVDRHVLSAAIYTGANDEEVLGVAEFSDAFGPVDQKRLRREIDRALNDHHQDADADDDFRVDESHNLEIEIRGQPAQFLIQEGATKAGQKKIRAMGEFEGHQGTALLFMQVDAEQHNLEQVEQTLRSIKLADWLAIRTRDHATGASTARTIALRAVGAPQKGHLTMWLRNQRFQRLVGGGVLERTSIRLVAFMELLGLGGHKDSDVVRLIRRVRRERRWLLTANEAYTVYSLARAQSKQEGHIAEVGTYQGGSARMICEAKGDRPLHLFDTFEGLPTPTVQDGNVHRAHQYSCSLESVRGYLDEVSQCVVLQRAVS